jgi:Putative peptidoglycan binding domain
VIWGLGTREAAIGGLGLAATGVALIALASGGDGGGAQAQESGVPTAPLERRDLASSQSVDGTLGYAGEATVINRLSGTFTWLPAEGDVIARGHRLFEVDGDPVILMYGDVPAYRDLTTGVSGPDVEELESNLAELGFDPGTVDEEFTSSTAAAVSDWQDSLGLDETGTVELGRVAFMSGPRRVTALSVSLGSSGSSGGGSDPSAAAADQDPAAATTALASYAVDLPNQKAPKKQKPKRKKPSRPSGDQNQPTGGSGDQATPSSTGDDASTGDSSSADDASSAPSTEVMTTSSVRRVVTVELDPSDADLVSRGGPAQVELPDGTRVKGHVSSIGTVAADDSSDSAAGGDGSSDPTIEVTIALPEGSKVAGLDQAPVTVDLTDEVRRDVFVVPVESLLGTAGGGYAIEVRDPSGRRQLPVEPGLFANGYVEVSGNGLRDGMRVEVPGE